jgi:flagellar basal-body rod protein FlgB
MLDPTSGALEKYMDLLAVRQKLITSNIANADTPGYKTQDIDFQSEFQSAINGAANPTEVPGLKGNNDGNNVNLDREARLLSENALRFNIAAQLIRGQLSQMKSAIDGGTNG